MTFSTHFYPFSRNHFTLAVEGRYQWNVLKFIFEENVRSGCSVVHRAKVINIISYTSSKWKTEAPAGTNEFSILLNYTVTIDSVRSFVVLFLHCWRTSECCAVLGIQIAPMVSRLLQSKWRSRNKRQCP